MSTSDSCKDGASKSNDDGLCEMNNMLNNMSTDDNTRHCSSYVTYKLSYYLAAG